MLRASLPEHRQPSEALACEVDVLDAATALGVAGCQCRTPDCNLISALTTAVPVRTVIAIRSASYDRQPAEMLS